MSLLVRKIEKAKWLQNNIQGGEDVSADAITNCLKTKGNTLSTWSISTIDELSEAVLAIVSGHEHLDTIDIVYFDSNLLKEDGIALQSSPGKVPIQDLIEQHKDIINLTYKSLGTVANYIVESIKQDNVKRYTKGMIKKILNKAIDEGRLQKTALSESVRDKI